MSEEEKKAIERAKEILDKTTFLSDIGHKDLEILLNLIEKQEKEIEQINNRDIKRLAEIGELRTKNSYLKQENEYLNCICESDKDNYIDKGKIREKIEELEKAGTTETRNNKNEVVEQHYFLQDEIDVLRELLEEE